MGLAGSSSSSSSISGRFVEGEDEDDREAEGFNKATGGLRYARFTVAARKNSGAYRTRSFTPGAQKPRTIPCYMTVGCGAFSGCLRSRFWSRRSFSLPTRVSVGGAGKLTVASFRKLSGPWSSSASNRRGSRSADLRIGALDADRAAPIRRSALRALLFSLSSAPNASRCSTRTPSPL